MARPSLLYVIMTSSPTPPISLIYYASPRFVQQVSSALLGKTPDETTSSRTERKGLSRKLRGELTATLGILGLRTEGARETAQGTEQLSAMKYAVTDDDRAIAVFQHVLGNCVSSADAIGRDPQPNQIYWIHGLMKLRYRRMPGGEKPMVEVECRTKTATVVGVTSPDKWVAPSLLSELIYLSGATNKVPVTALFAPLGVEQREATIHVRAKYIAIGGASVVVP